MNRVQFMEQLKKLLSDISEEERQDSISSAQDAQDLHISGQNLICRLKI